MPDYSRRAMPVNAHYLLLAVGRTEPEMMNSVRIRCEEEHSIGWQHRFGITERGMAMGGVEDTGYDAIPVFLCLAFHFAQRPRCAGAILFRASADMVRRVVPNFWEALPGFRNPSRLPSAVKG